MFSRSERSAGSTANAPRGVMDNSRICAFSDGVFSITITLLVFQLQVPQGVASADLPQTLFNMWPRLLSYVISIVVIGIYWVGQHNMFFHIKGHDRVLLWLNILFLGLVASMPFWTDLLRTYHDEPIAIVCYAGTLALTGFSLDAIWRYASGDHRLVDPNIDPQLVAFIHRRVLLAPIVYLVSIALSFINTVVAELLFAVVALFYIVPNPLDHYHHRALNTTDREVDVEE